MLQRSLRLWMSLFTLTLLSGLAGEALAQRFPDRPIKLIVPFGAGSAVDTIARAIAAQAGEQMGQAIQVDNRTGANGIIAAEAVARSAPDGYTLFMPNDGIMAANPALYARLPYDPVKDFTAITLTSTVHLVLVSHTSFPASKLKVLAVSTPKRSSAMPNVPTIAESGVAGYGYAAWNGIVAPAGTPPEVVRRLHSEFAKAMVNPAVRAKLGGLGFDLVGVGPQEFGELIRSDVVRLGRLVRSAGIQVN